MDDMDDNEGHSIRIVARRTGLTSHAIRVWEKRYGAVTPTRTPTNRRVYSDADIERLQLLRRATLAGHSIGRIAKLPTGRLHDLLAADEPLTPAPSKAIGARSADLAPPSILTACIRACEDLDAMSLEEVLTRAAVNCSKMVFIEQVIVPLMHRIGDLWHEGVLRAAHEHLASAVVRTLLGSLSRGFAPVASAPALVVATPTGQMHELGALIVAVTAASDGWRVSYLGPSLPAEEIAGAAHQSGARAVALSLIYPADDPYLNGELSTLRRGLADGVLVMVGGQAAGAYENAFNEIGALWVKDLADLRRQLRLLRLPKLP
jgi:DNA-binding transcriptional MerR regulator/methylmalonyl-CoA mutase cobalamin-binding subunit